MTDMDLEQIIARVNSLVKDLEPYREMLLANVVMIGEIPAPTFGEQERISFLKQRFTECGLHNCSTDELGNGLGILPGSEGTQTILLAAHADTPFAAAEDHTYTIDAGRICGPGVADNSLSLAVLATLPTILEGLDIRFRNDLLFMGASRSLEQGNQQGLRFLLANSNRPLAAGVSIEGVPLGRLRYRSMASLGGMIACNVNRRVSQKSAIEVLNQIIYQIGCIPLLEESHAGLVLGSVAGGASFKIPARNARLKFQLRSDSDQTLMESKEKVENLLDEVGKEKGVSAHLEVIASTMAGGLDSSHPLVLLTRRVMTTLGLQPRGSIYSATFSPYAEKDIPAVCIGITNGDNVNYPDEYIEIEPILTGVAQLIGILLAIDGGHCVEY